VNAGYSVDQPSRFQPWALEMKIHDPDRNVIWSGFDSTPGKPFGTEPI
jgi:hypothetical protein